MKNKLELYFHIPFCVQKCAYCDFLSFPAEEDTVGKYVERLKKEMTEYKEETQAYQVSSIFWGGGTPSLLSGRQMGELMEKLFHSFDVLPHAEISMEANPGTLNRQKLEEYKRAGINRLSMGLQSADGRELKLLGRIHTYGEFLENYREARRAGYENINVDLMSALPGQTVISYADTLEKVISLEPEHISAYSLIIEEGTPFYREYREDDLRRERGEVPELLPSEEEERDMYRMTAELLVDAGYQRYEISNYAKPGRRCRHNCGYWQGTEYLGLGLGASSYFKGKRMKNEPELLNYMNHSFHKEDVTILTAENYMEEFMFLGLRLIKGVSGTEFARRFGKRIEQVYGHVLHKFLDQQLMEESGGRWRLTPQGIDVSNYVLSEFLLT